MDCRGNPCGCPPGRAQDPPLQNPSPSKGGHQSLSQGLAEYPLFDTAPILHKTTQPSRILSSWT